MDDAGVTDIEAESAAALPDGWGEVPPSLRPPRKLPKWPFVLIGLVLALGVGLGAAWPIDLPYYALSPGPVKDVSDFVDVPEPNAADGDLFFLTVTLEEVNLLEYLAAQLDGQVDIRPRENIRPVGVSREDLRRQNLDSMEISQQTAIFIALSELGYEVTFEGTGALVIGLVEGSAADGVLLENDVLIGVNDEPVKLSTEAVDLIGSFRPGDEVKLTINRPNPESETGFDQLEIVLTLGPFRAEDDDGNLIEDPDRGMIGVLLGNADVEIIFPVDVDIDARNIGGPSAGLMFTLEIMNQLSEEDITRGHRIAGTGTIKQDGAVGVIGGVRQKVFAAIDAGAEYVLVPAGNIEDAREAAGDDITVVEVAEIDDALAFLDSL